MFETYVDAFDLDCSGDGFVLRDRSSARLLDFLGPAGALSRSTLVSSRGSLRSPLIVRATRCLAVWRIPLALALMISAREGERTRSPR
jgi:hypothetical protein